MGCELEADPARYLDVLRGAFDKHYRDRSDVWTDDAEMRAFPAFIHGRLKLAPATRVLDIGCGSGRDVAYFAQLYAHADGIDLYAHPAWQTHRPNTRFHAGDFLSFSGGPYDLIFDNGCFHHQHPDHYGAYLARIAALLAPAGHYVLSTFKNASLAQRVDDNGRLHRYFTDAELHGELARAGFTADADLDVWRQRCGDYYRLTFCRRSG